MFFHSNFRSFLFPCMFLSSHCWHCSAQTVSGIAMFSAFQNYNTIYILPFLAPNCYFIYCSTEESEDSYAILNINVHINKMIKSTYEQLCTTDIFSPASLDWQQSHCWKETSRHNKHNAACRRACVRSTTECVRIKKNKIINFYLLIY